MYMYVYSIQILYCDKIMQVENRIVSSNNQDIIYRY